MALTELQKCKCGCGKSFEPKVTRGVYKLFYNTACTRRHHDRIKNEREKRKRHAALGGRTCKNQKCDAPLPADARPSQLYCSRDCLEVARRAEYKEEAPDRYCQGPWCNDVLPRTESRWKEDYCSDQCKEDAAELRKHLKAIEEETDFVGQIPGADVGLDSDYFAPSPKIRALEYQAND